MLHSSGLEFEVFLNFRGADTRYNFVDVLIENLDKAGICVFKDDENLEKGTKIEDLLLVIEHSKISIPIFSVDYASSRWCLRELVKMVECSKAKGQRILPVFYEIDPSVVRRQKWSYEEAFCRHEDRAISGETIQRWRAALEEVGSLSGWVKKEEDGLGKFVARIVSDVRKELKMPRAVTNEDHMPKLTAGNYSYWKPMMEDHLYCKDLHEPITHKEKPEEKSDGEWTLLNRKAVAMIRKHIDQSFFKHVSTYTNAYKLWAELESIIQNMTPRNKAYILRHLLKLEYKEDQNMLEHLDNFKGLIDKVETVELEINDELRAVLLLTSLPASWHTFVVNLNNLVPEGKLTMDTARDTLLNEEARRKKCNILSQSKVNKSSRS